MPPLPRLEEARDGPPPRQHRARRRRPRDAVVLVAAASGGPVPPQVGVLIASPRDAEAVAPIFDVLDELGVAYEGRYLSAHRTPREVVEYASAARDRGVRVIVCAAALAAHLAGITASCTTLPVVGLPLSGGVADGLDALLATVQMPRGMPVATVGVDAAANAALLAVQVVAADDDELTAAVEGYRRQLVDDYRQADAAWQAAQSR